MGTRELRAELLALHPRSSPRVLEASEVLDGLTPDDVCEAAEGVRVGRTLDERNDAVAWIVRRRQRASATVREDEAGYASSAKDDAIRAAAMRDRG